MIDNNMPGEVLTLECPDCGRQMSAQRDPTDPPNAAGAKLQCDRCDDGDRHAPEFFDADGRWVHPTEHLRAALTQQESRNAE